jgi:hypothetical protein
MYAECYPPPPTLTEYICTFATVVRLRWSNSPEIYAGGSVAVARVSNAGEVKGDDPDKK